MSIIIRYLFTLGTTLSRYTYMMQNSHLLQPCGCVLEGQGHGSSNFFLLLT